MRTIDREDVPVAIKDDNVELRMAEVGDMTVCFVTAKKGAAWRPRWSGCPTIYASARTGATCSRDGSR